VNEHAGLLKQAPPEAVELGRQDLPVYASVEGGAGIIVVTSDPVDYVRRPAPLANVREGYGIIVVGESMVPAFEPGDTVLIHPHLPPAPDTDVVLTREVDGEIRITVKRLLRVTSTHWHLRQWNPPGGLKADFSLLRSEWQKCHRVVGKYSRR